MGRQSSKFGPNGKETHSMDNSHKRGIETRRRNEAARKERRMKEEREVRAQIEALRKVRDDPNTTSSERLRAVELLVEFERKGYSYL